MQRLWLRSVRRPSHGRKSLFRGSRGILLDISILVTVAVAVKEPTEVACCFQLLYAVFICCMLQVCGKPVGVHISRGRSVDQLVEDQIADVQDDADPDASVNKLLRLLRSHTDRKAAISAALKAVLTLPSRKVVPAENPVPVESSPPVSEPPPEPIPDPDSFLDSFLRCKHLVETFRANPSTHNKTPLAILHEYATRLGLEVCSSLT